jgi:hypothetical protein
VSVALRTRPLLASLLACAVLSGASAGSAGAQGLVDDGGASWRSAQPPPPAPPPGVEPSSTPVGLGHIGDIEFWAPNRGLLITAGNGNTVKPGVWAYNGRVWHELSEVCGGTDGRIAWAGPEEFWTISDGRPGQAANAKGELPQLADDTLCHFAGGRVVASYATPAFNISSYPAMHAAGCISANDCWFAGEPLPGEQPGSFHLHWNGSSVTAEPYTAESYPVQDMRLFRGQLVESVQLLASTQSEPPPLHVINREKVSPTFQALSGMPLYGEPGELPSALGFLHLSSAASALWGATGGAISGSEENELAPGQPTVVRLAGGEWSQLLGATTSPSGSTLFGRDVINSIAAEPDGEHAWLALQTRQDAANPSPTATALVARIAADGSLSTEDLQSLPSGEELGPKGGTAKVVCPAAHDCWLASTQGWLFHLTNGELRPQDTDPAFSGLISERPADASTLQLPPDSVPPDTSGLPGEVPSFATITEPSTRQTAATATAPLLSHLHSRLHGDTLELRFHLAVKTRIRLLAERRKRVVASTPKRTLAAGDRKLLLRLNPRSWPTRLRLETHPLAPLPTVSANSESTQTLSTSLVVLPNLRSLAQARLP